MGILNYSTTISASRTIGDVQKLLLRRGVRKTFITYDVDERPAGIGFEMVTDYGARSFEVPVNADGVFEKLCSDPSVPKGFKTQKQALNVAWRIVHDWLKAQYALLDTNMTTLDQAMFGYMVDGRGRTSYSVMRDASLKELEGL